MSESESDSEEGENVQIEKLNLDYEEIDITSKFKKIDLQIYMALQRAEFPKEFKEEIKKDEGEDENEEEEEEEDSAFDIESFVEDYNPFKIKHEEELEEFKNRVKYIHTLGIYGGDRDPDTKERNGKGHCIFPNRDEYVGDYKDGLKNGYGRYYYKSIKPEQIDLEIEKAKIKLETNEKLKELLKGTDYVEAAKFIKPKVDGKCLLFRVRYVIENGPYPFYFGDWVADKKEGGGLIKYKNGSIYRGQFKDDKRNGEGDMVYENGDKYSGEWLDGKKHGNGVYWFKSLNCKYVGKFENGNIVEGEWQMSDGIKYQGKFKDNAINGEGSFFFPSLEKCKLVGISFNKKWIPDDFVSI